MLKLEQGKTYQVKVLKVEKSIRRPEWMSKNGMMYNYILTVEAKNGKEIETGTLEHASPHMFEANLSFVVGISQWVKCRACSEKGCEVEPYDPESDGVGDSSQQARIDAAKKLVDPTYKPTPPAAPIGDTVNLSGNSFIFCLSYFKDLLVAEISTRPEGYVMDDVQLVERALKGAKQLNAGVVAFIKEGK